MEYILIFLLSTVCLSGFVSADCFRLSGCRDNDTTIEFEEGMKWFATYESCYVCKCYKVKKPVLKCIEVADEQSIKKTGDIRLSKNFAVSFVPAEEVEITEKNVNVSCPPIPMPLYDEETQQLESATYRNVYYYYNTKETLCCNGVVRYHNIHPSCEEIKVGKCEFQVVKKDNHKEQCDMPYGMSG